MAPSSDGAFPPELGRLIVEQATDYAVVTTDLDGFITNWSPGAALVFGYEAEEVIDQNSAILFTPEDRAAGQHVQELVTACRAGVALDVRWHLRRDGSRVFVNGSVHPLKDAEGRDCGFVKIARDETARQQAIEGAFEHQDVLVREVSHRVKNSLSIVAGLLALQAKSSEDPEVRQALRTAEVRVQAVAQVHDQLWRSDDATRVRLDDYLDALCARLEQTGPGHKVVFTGQPMAVPTDLAVPLGLITNELVTNAVKYAYPAAQGTVEVALAIAGDRIRLEVRDRGVGVPAGFELTTSKAGLGMRVLAKLVRQVRGEIRAENCDKGAHFVVELPRP